MTHHRIHSCGQLFSFSGIDGDFIEGRAEGAGVDSHAEFAEGGENSECGRFLIAYEDARNIVGLSPVKPVLGCGGAVVVNNGGSAYAEQFGNS